MDTYIFRKTINRLPGAIVHCIPTPDPRVLEGYACRQQAGTYLQEKAYKRVLLITDQTIHALGYDQLIEQGLQERQIDYVKFDAISSEPDIVTVEACRKVALQHKAECVIALGGGSVMDISKMVAAGAKMPHCSIRSLLLKFLPVPGKTLPIVAVPTTAGTGAEVSVGAILLNDKGIKKSTVLLGLNVELVILDSELTIHAPLNVTAACGMDALSHAIEGAVSAVKVNDQDAYYAKEGAKLVLQHLPEVMAHPDNADARMGMCRAALYGGHTINKQLAGYVHAFAHSIGAKYHLSHGNAISLVLLPVLEYQKQACMDKYAMLARYCHITDKKDDSEAAEDFLKAVANLLDLCGMNKLKSPVQTSDYASLVKMIAADSINYSSSITLKNSDIIQILKTITVNQTA